MSGRFTFSSAYGPQMRREELVTLSRTTSQQSTTNKLNGTTPSPSAMTAHPAPRNGHSHQRKNFVFTDPVAFRYLEEDPSTMVIERRGKLEGYQLYLVEQWACSRVHPTFVITTYTGDKENTVIAGVLGVPVDEELWSPRMRVYFKAISQYHARPQETPLGILMVTNLNSFPPSLSVIAVPDGDIKKHRDDFLVNEDLKRLGCSGRAGMSLAAPAPATQAKFQQLYRTSERIPFYGAVIELVKLCQVALMIFGKLEQEYADGCLCDVTEKALTEWWTEIGSEHYNAEPTDGILGPTTVAGLLGMLMGARNRLNYLNAPVAKDAFDVYALKRGIGHFQKQHKLERTRRLDRHTLDRLHKVTAKAAAGEGWAVPKAVKSTVAELSGKGGEMVMGMVGRDKANIGDIETLDIESFISLVHGERAKWLWYGKPKRNGGSEEYGKPKESDNMSFYKDSQGGYMWTHSRSGSIPPEGETDVRRTERESPGIVYNTKPPGSTLSMPESPSERDYQLRKTVIKSVTGKMENARSGFGRIKDAVGLRGHASKHSKDESADSSYFSPAATPAGPSNGTPGGPAPPNRAFTWKDTPAQYQNGAPKPFKEAPSRPQSSGRALDSDSPHSEPRKGIPTISVEESKTSEAESKWIEQVREIRRDIVVNDPSILGSDGDLEGPFLEAERDPTNFQVLLHRRRSIAGGPSTISKVRNEAYWPRQMSFGDASEAVLGWEPICDLSDNDDGDNWTALQKQRCIAEDARRLYEKIADLQDSIGPWVEDKLQGVEKLDEQFAQDQDTFQARFLQLSQHYQDMKQHSASILESERTHVSEAIKDIEILGAKLEYEINALVSKVQDVEDGVQQFEQQVQDLEERADELEQQLKTESWLHWLVRSVTGIGSGPNITAPRRGSNEGKEHEN